MQVRELDNRLMWLLFSLHLLNITNVPGYYGTDEIYERLNKFISKNVVKCKFQI